MKTTDFEQPGKPLNIANVFEDTDKKTNNLETLTNVQSVIFVTMPFKLNSMEDSLVGLVTMHKDNTFISIRNGYYLEGEIFTIKLSEYETEIQTFGTFSMSMYETKDDLYVLLLKFSGNDREKDYVKAFTMDYERRNGYNDIKEVRTDSSEEIQKWVKDEDDRRKMCKVPKSNMSLEEEMKFIKDKT